jgi:uncharacterized membrane protein
MEGGKATSVGESQHRELSIWQSVTVGMASQEKRSEALNGSLTYPPPPPTGLTPVLDRNMSALYERRRKQAEATSWQERTAASIGRFTGSMPFVYLHLLVFGFWITANLGWIPGVSPWDDSFVILAMIASVEAIFLSTFVLITQNYMAQAADRRADLDLQVSLLAEHEITKLASLVSDIAVKLNVETAQDKDVEEIKQNIAPDAVLDEIERLS